MTFNDLMPVNIEIVKKVSDFLFDLECTLKKWDAIIIIVLILSLYSKQTNQEKNVPKFHFKTVYQTEEAIITPKRLVDTSVEKWYNIKYFLSEDVIKNLIK